MIDEKTLKELEAQTEAIEITGGEMTRKQDFIRYWNLYPEQKLLCTIIQLPNGALEIITNSNKLDEKFQYYCEKYDDDMCLIANPEEKIMDWMVA